MDDTKFDVLINDAYKEFQKNSLNSSKDKLHKAIFENEPRVFYSWWITEINSKNMSTSKNFLMFISGYCKQLINFNHR